MRNRKWVNCVLFAASLLLLVQACGKKDETIPESEMLKIQHAMMEKFRNTTLSSDPDDDFYTLVMIYNETAIAFAQKELVSGKNQRMRKIAEEVIAERSQERDEIQKLIQTHLIRITIPEFKNQIRLSLERAEKNAGLQATTGNIDKDFAAVMICHNQGSIENANLHVIYGVHKALKALGKGMIEKRDQQTRYLQAWLTGNRNPD